MISNRFSRRIACAAAFATALPMLAMAGDHAQPRMQDALEALQAARDKLAAAAPDKAGHRVVALKLVDQALAQVRLGIQAGSTR
jgi:hypothetical protein